MVMMSCGISKNNTYNFVLVSYLIILVVVTLVAFSLTDNAGHLVSDQVGINQTV